MAPGVVVELVAVGEDPLDESGVLGQPAADGEQADRHAGLCGGVEEPADQSRVAGQVECESDLVPGTWA
jgi:hypothetical protein